MNRTIDYSAQHGWVNTSHMARRGGLGPQGHAAIQRAVEQDLARGNPAVTSHEDPGELEVEESLQWLPLRTSNPKRPRCSEGAYDPVTQSLYVRFMRPTPGHDEYVYEGVSRQEWYNFRRAVSPGEYINRVLNGHQYHKIS